METRFVPSCLKMCGVLTGDETVASMRGSGFGLHPPAVCDGFVFEDGALPHSFPPSLSDLDVFL